MNDITCTVFMNGDIFVFRGEGNALALPESFLNYPLMISNEYGTKVILRKRIKNDDDYVLLREGILAIIEMFRQIGVPRIEFPRWNEMLIYPVEPDQEIIETKYWNPEQVIDSYLNLRGPEFII